MASLLDELVAKLNKLSPEEKAKAIKVATDLKKKMCWLPNPGPQTDAFNSKADILLFGGEPGGGKTGLGLGLALTQHYRSLVVRKQFTDLDGVIDNLVGMVGNSKALVRGSRPKYRKANGGVINFQGMGESGQIDTGKQGNPHDFIYIDEAAQLAEIDIRLLLGWNRISSDTPTGQRCRVVLGSNPPLNSTGLWLGEFFGAWFDEKHSNPAKHGELRWYYFDDDGKSIETTEQEPFELGGMTRYPKSRTFIPSSLEDNPFQNAEEYKANLQQLPEPFRTQILSGNFLASRQDQDYQVIPTAWVRDAMERWKASPNPPAGVPMCAMGCDMVMGGKDDAIIAPRYDYWFDKFVAIPGKDVKDGNLGGHIITNRKDNATVIIDMGGGYGGATWNCLKDNIGTQYLRAYKGSEAGIGRTKDKQLGFFNKRSSSIWALRDALDPSQLGGSPICLPPDPLLVADLTAPTFEITSRGVKIESKEDVCKKLGRSPDRGDAIVMSNVEGVRGLTPLTRRDLKQFSMPTHAKMSSKSLTLGK